MKRTSTPSLLVALLLIFLPCATMFGQRSDSLQRIESIRLRQQVPSQPDMSRRPEQQRRDERQKDDEETIRITSNLVQVDAVVTDDKGRQVTDLTAEDFEIYEAGKAQPITNFSYISAQPNGAATDAASPAKAAPKGKDAPPPPPAMTKRGPALRTVALLVDDLCMSHASVGAVQNSLKKFVDEQMQPGDLAAVFRTRSGNSVLQQFTSDRNHLHRAISKVRWYPPLPGIECGGEFEPARADYTVKAPRGGADAGARAFEDERSRQARQRIEDTGRDQAVAGTFGVLGLTLRGLREAPGRKSVVLFSDGLPLFSRNRESGRAYDRMRRIVDAANRAGVVIYTIDARGVTIPGFIGAQDEALPEETGRLASERIEKDAASRAGFSVADDTGGFFIKNMNDLNRALRRVLEDQSGYYLIGYRPPEETLKKLRDTTRDISVRVKRPGLRVRSRKGFFAPTVEESRPDPRRGADRELYAALVAPVDKGEVETRLTAHFGDMVAGGAVIRTMLHLDGRGLTFKDEASGWKKLTLDVAAATIGENGKIADEFTRTHTVRVPAEAVTFVQRNGVVYTADVPVKKPGAYQFRIVVRDSESQRLGSASQFIEAPDLKKDSLALSGITLREAQQARTSGPVDRARATAETALATVVSPSDPAVRRFAPGAVLSYEYRIYNAKLGGGANSSRLTTQLRLFHDGQPVLTGPDEPFEPSAQADAARLSESRFLKISAQAAPGDYLLQIVVNDIAPDGKRRTATQWIDFEVVK